jgi:hypothetical protein
MRFVFYTALGIGSVTLLTAAQKYSPTSDHSGCGVVRQALNDSGRIKAGMTRRDVEKYFSVEGGMNFPLNTRYVYSKCRYIKIDIEFRSAPGNKKLMSPNDVVSDFSKLYIEYPIAD